MKTDLKHRRFLVVSRFDEDLSWLSSVPAEWKQVVYDKSQDIAIGNPPGREAHTYLHFIVANYDRLDALDEIVFCQGHPFDHDERFIENLSNPNIVDFGIPYASPSDGSPHTEHCACDAYCKVFGLPVKETYYFTPGAQFRVFGMQILSRPKDFYLALLALTIVDKYSAWTLERLWKLIFQ